MSYIRNEKKKEPDQTDEELDALANLGHTEESGNSRDLDEIEKKEEIEEINETEEIQEEEIPPLDEGDYQDVDYKSMLEDTLMALIKNFENQKQPGRGKSKEVTVCVACGTGLSQERQTTGCQNKLN